MTPGDDGVDVSFTLKNTGKEEAAEVAQVYVGEDSPAVVRPLRELKGFRKVRLGKGESTRVSIHLDREAFSYYDVMEHGWKVAGGAYTVSVGSDADTMLLSAGVNL